MSCTNSIGKYRGEGKLPKTFLLKGQAAKGEAL